MISDLLVRSDSDPAFPGLVLGLHVVAKGVEMGSLIGLAIGLGASLPATGRFKVRTVLKYCELGVAFGTVLGALALLGKSRKLDEEGIKDRGYRLSHREAKFDLDAAFLCGGALSGLVFLPDACQEFAGATKLDRLVRGFCFGGAVGFAANGGVKVAWKMLNKTLVME
jgi:hypothetical protein